MNPIQSAILKQFLRKKSASFSHIQKQVGVESNKLSYHLANMETRGTIEKIGDRYCLSDHMQKILPYLESVLEEKKFPLTIVKLYVGKGGKTLLTLREKEPFLSYWELPTTRLRIGETVEDAAKRLAREHKVAVENIAKDRIVREQFMIEGKVEYDYFIHFVTAKTMQELGVGNDELANMRVIPTDILYIRKELGESIVLNLDGNNMTPTVS